MKSAPGEGNERRRVFADRIYPSTDRTAGPYTASVNL